jgi:hypothetical protein
MNIRSGLNWFVGAGIQFDFNYLNFDGVIGFHDRFYAGPTIGLEYDFNQKNIPLILALDYRPAFVYIPSSKNVLPFQHQFGISLRYTFNEK